MDPLLQSALLLELDGQCNNCRLGLALMRQSQEAAADPSAAQDSLQRFWFCVQGMLAAVANISKILYPTGQNVPASRVASSGQLRTLLGATATAPFDAKSRQMRNNYEHLDERIDVKWWTSPDRRSLRADYNFYPVGVLEAQFGDVNCFRNYDTLTETLTFMGEHFQIPAIENVVIALQHQIARHLT